MLSPRIGWRHSVRVYGPLPSRRADDHRHRQVSGTKTSGPQFMREDAKQLVKHLDTADAAIKAGRSWSARGCPGSCDVYDRLKADAKDTPHTLYQVGNTAFATEQGHVIITTAFRGTASATPQGNFLWSRDIPPQSKCIVWQSAPHGPCFFPY